MSYVVAGSLFAFRKGQSQKIIKQRKGRWTKTAEWIAVALLGNRIDFQRRPTGKKAAKTA